VKCTKISSSPTTMTKLRHCWCPCYNYWYNGLQSSAVLTYNICSDTDAFSRHRSFGTLIPPSGEEVRKEEIREMAYPLLCGPASGRWPLAVRPAVHLNAIRSLFMAAELDATSRPPTAACRVPAEQQVATDDAS